MGQEPDAVTPYGSDDTQPSEDTRDPTAADPTEMRAEIAATRSDLSETVDTLQERLSPQQLMDTAKASMYVATMGRVEEMVDSARESVYTTGESIMDTVRENPIPVALIGLGLGWLMWGRRNRGQQSAYRTDNRSPIRYTDRTGGYQRQRPPQRAQDKTSQAAQQAHDTLHDMGSQVQEKTNQIAHQAHDTVHDMGSQAHDLTQQATGQAQQQMQQVRSWFAETLDESPLAVAAGALALGALVALAIPETAQEHQVMGPARDALMNKAQDVAQDTMQKVQSVAHEATDAARQEAQRQGAAQ
jgi:hypothetical protein